MCLSNLTNKQWRLVDTLKSSDEHIILEADKNLGGCATERPIYMHKGVDEHLGDRNVYKPLTKTEAQQLIAVTRYKINILLTKYKDEITPAEWVYIHEGLYQFVDRIARFRMSAKVHKFPWKTRPIVRFVGTSMNCVSKWLDYWLQQLKPFISTYLHQRQRAIAGQNQAPWETSPKLLAIHRRRYINVHKHRYSTCHPRHHPFAG